VPLYITYTSTGTIHPTSSWVVIKISVLTDFVDSVLQCPLSQDKLLHNFSDNIFVSTFRRRAEERELLFHTSGVRE